MRIILSFQGFLTLLDARSKLQQHVFHIDPFRYVCRKKKYKITDLSLNQFPHSDVTNLYLFYHSNEACHKSPGKHTFYVQFHNFTNVFSEMTMFLKDVIRTDIQVSCAVVFIIIKLTLDHIATVPVYLSSSDCGKLTEWLSNQIWLQVIATTMKYIRK